MGLPAPDISRALLLVSTWSQLTRPCHKSTNELRNPIYAISAQEVVKGLNPAKVTLLQFCASISRHNVNNENPMIIIGDIIYNGEEAVRFLIFGVRVKGLFLPLNACCNDFNVPARLTGSRIML